MLFGFSPGKGTTDANFIVRQMQELNSWHECVKVDTNRLGLVQEDARYRDRWRSLTTGNRSTVPESASVGPGEQGVVL